jgi:AcrR family transcriptional regulator
MASDRRIRKRLAMRESISNAATFLFMQHGFDNVTVDQIAEAADVGRKTVFNYFPRKEDMFFDRDEEIREMLREVVQKRSPLVSPLEAYRLFAHQLIAENSPYVMYTNQSWIDTIQRSETLKARVRAIRDEIAEFIAATLSEDAGHAVSEPAAIDPAAQLAADLLLATWTVAILQSHRIFRLTQDTEQATAAFLALVDRGSVGLKAAMAGTPYA